MNNNELKSEVQKKIIRKVHSDFLNHVYTQPHTLYQFFAIYSKVAAQTNKSCNKTYGISHENFHQKTENCFQTVWQSGNWYRYLFMICVKTGSYQTASLQSVL